MSEMRTPALDGVCVLDLSTVGPGTRCTRILADFGARVVKVGAPPHKADVQVEPRFYAYSARRGLQQVRIDLKQDAGREAFLQLARHADVVLESYRPGVAARLGIGFDAVRAVNPRIIYCSTSGYGQSGPASGWAGHDLNYLAMGGYLHVGGRGEGGKPPLPGATIADSAAGGMHAALSIMAALLARERSGEGACLDVSVTEGVLQLMSLYIDEHLATGASPGPGHDVLTGRYACYDTYCCADRKWLAVGAIEGRFFANLCRALGCEHWSAHQYDDAVQDQIRADFAAAFMRRPRDAWALELAPADTCVAPVNAIEELVEDAHLAARGAFGEAVHAQHGRFRQLAPVLAGQQRAPGPVPAGDAELTQTETLLREAGVSPGAISAWRTQGAIA